MTTDILIWIIDFIGGTFHIIWDVIKAFFVYSLLCFKLFEQFVASIFNPVLAHYGPVRMNTELTVPLIMHTILLIGYPFMVILHTITPNDIKKLKDGSGDTPILETMSDVRDVGAGIALGVLLSVIMIGYYSLSSTLYLHKGGGVAGVIVIMKMLAFGMVVASAAKRWHIFGIIMILTAYFTSIITTY